MEEENHNPKVQQESNVYSCWFYKSLDIIANVLQEHLDQIEKAEVEGSLVMG